jgi:hypothetical protein
MSNTPDDLPSVLRSFDNGRTSTHYLECWKVHPICALHIAADEIERLRRELAMIRLIRLSEDLGLYE